MRTKEGRPSREEVSAQRSLESTQDNTIDRANAHHLTPSDAAVFAALIAGVALLLLGLCAATWLVA
jgi:hypothetical protein